MQANGVKPSIISFTILMNASIAANDIDRAFDTFHLMRSHVAKPSRVTFNSLIHGYCDNRYICFLRMLVRFMMHIYIYICVCVCV